MMDKAHLLICEAREDELKCHKSEKQYFTPY